MNWLLSAVGLLFVSALAALVMNQRPRWAAVVAVSGVLTAVILGLIPTILVLFCGKQFSFSSPWTIPYAAFSLLVDPLSAFFLLLIFPISALAAIYGAQYLMPGCGQKPVGFSWFCFNTLIASMVLVVTAHNAVLFLIVWEIMALTSFFLVVYDDEKENVRQAGITYLVATHLGTAFLLGFFLLLFGKGPGLEFSVNAGIAPQTASLLFILALIGFGTKAGLVPFHVWLPEAHPAAPSHVSAIMSALMIKTGIYGLLRALTFLGTPPVWWGGLLVVLGLVSGIYGIIFALAQNDVKRFLAYSSIENIGIIAMGIGVGMLGMSYGVVPLMILGFASALLHTLNHSVFKGLLFLGSGAVAHAAETRDMDLMGGLLKRMPLAGGSLFIGVMAISALPPLNGFVSEFLLYLAGFKGIVMSGSGFAIQDARFVFFLSVIFGLAIIGGLSLAGFTKFFGMIFLGEPRSPQANQARESGKLMHQPLVILAGICVVLGISSPFYLTALLQPVLVQVLNAPDYLVAKNLIVPQEILGRIVFSGLILVVLLGALFGFRQRLLAGKKVGEGLTWDCGYAQPTARMQYTATSFIQPLTLFFSGILLPRIRKNLPRGIFPGKASWAIVTPDVFGRGLYHRVYDFISQKSSQWRWIQHGRAHFYILYILVMLLVLLIWKMR